MAYLMRNFISVKPELDLLTNIVLSIFTTLLISPVIFWKKLHARNFSTTCNPPLQVELTTWPCQSSTLWTIGAQFQLVELKLT